MIKKILITTSILASSLSIACATNSPSSLDIKAFSVTKILIDKKSTEVKVKWNKVWSAEYYELSRIQDGKESPLGSSKISKDTDFFDDTEVKEGVKYRYKIYALDSNNKILSRGDTEEIPVTSSDTINSIEFVNLSSTDRNKVSREEVIKWSSVSADLYYSSIKNPTNNTQIFGSYSKIPNIGINLYSTDVVPSDVLLKDYPIVIKNGLEKDIDYKFSVYSIKFNNPDMSKANSILIKQSKEIIIGI